MAAKNPQVGSEAISAGGKNSASAAKTEQSTAGSADKTTLADPKADKAAKPTATSTRTH